MNLLLRFRPSISLLVLTLILFSWGPVPPLCAEDSPLNSVLDAAKALVEVQSVNTTVMSGKSRGFFDKVTGQLFVTKKVRPLSYTRNGSGVIIDPRGIIVTNAHTIRGAGGLGVTLFDGTNATVKEASLVPGTDLAFLLIDPPYALSWVPLADGDKAVVGASVYTIGHSEWLKNTVLGGRLTSVLREDFNGENHVTALRLNFDMEKGDSGCPVLNSRGELLGIVEAGSMGPGDITIAIAANAITIAYKAYLEKLDQK